MIMTKMKLVTVVITARMCIILRRLTLIIMARVMRVQWILMVMVGSHSFFIYGYLFNIYGYVLFSLIATDMNKYIVLNRRSFKFFLSTNNEKRMRVGCNVNQYRPYNLPISLFWGWHGEAGTYLCTELTSQEWSRSAFTTSPGLTRG